VLAPASGEPERVLSELSNELMSPYCPGRTIASCPSEQARKLEDQILAQAQAGRSREQIEESLVERFGPQIVGYAPQPIVLWGATVAGLCGLLLVAWAGRRWLRRPAVAGAGAGANPSPVAAAASGGPSKAERARLDDALDDLDEF
jgi:cytochrome c-type biogenesis protein CcmH/NrfF